MDSVKSFLGKKPTKKKVKFSVPPPPKPTPVSATKKAGDKIVKMLSGENPTPSRKTNKRQAPKMTQQEINNRVLQIMTGGKLQKII